MRNIQADTTMREQIGGMDKSKEKEQKSE